MKRFLLPLLALAAWALAPSGASAQVQCGAINTVPSVGITCLQEPFAPTYSATAVGLVAAATPTDIACLQGAAGKVIRLQSLRISGTITTQLVVPVFLVKRASLDTGGTPATSTALPVAYALDSSNAAASASLNAWTANPTINDSSPGYIDSANLTLSKADSTNGSGAGLQTLFEYNERNFMQAPLLRTAAQALCVNLNSNAGTMTGNAISITFKWTELAQ